MMQQMHPSKFVFTFFAVGKKDLYLEVMMGIKEII
jgi:hypothetical protein